MLSPRGAPVPPEQAADGPRPAPGAGRRARTGSGRNGGQPRRGPSAGLFAALLPLLLALGDAGARPPEASWDNLCEECHGEVAEFSGKYLWYIDGRLEGRHHVEDLHLFIDKHYIPDHELEGMSELLTSLASTEARYVERCGECHGPVRDFVDKSIWVKKQGMTALGAGIEVEEFLATHRDIAAQDIDYYLRLFARMARNSGN